MAKKFNVMKDLFGNLLNKKEEHTKNKSWLKYQLGICQKLGFKTEILKIETNIDCEEKMIDLLDEILIIIQENEKQNHTS